MLEATTRDVAARMSEAAPDADLLEVRLDALAPGALDLRAIVAARPRPLLVTCRARRHGGGFPGDEGERLSLLAAAAALGAEWVDVERDAVDALPPLPAGTRLVVSEHVAGWDVAGSDVAGSNVAGSSRAGPVDPRALLARVRSPRAHVQKVAAPVASAADALALLRAAREEATPTVAVALGLEGLVSRLAGERWGAPWVYAAAGPVPAAPGQLPLRTLAGLRAGRRVTPATALYGVVGRPVAHSRSPGLMNAAFAALGVDAVYAWLETDAPGALLAEWTLDRGLAGLSVTAPHKERLAALLPLAGEARATGAVNTVVREPDGRLVGWNTDALAAETLLRRLLGAARARAGSRPRRVAVLGAGGAARAVVHAAARLGAEVVVFARRPGAARALAPLGARPGGTPADVPAAREGAFDVLVNATPAGTGGGPAPVDERVLGPGLAVYDLVHTPEETALVRAARARGAPDVATGLEHFALQAHAQLALWLGATQAARLSPAWIAERAAEPFSAGGP